MTTELAPLQSNYAEPYAGAPQQGALVEREKGRAVAEIQAALTIARTQERNELRAFAKARVSCQRVSFAEKAMYAYPRGGETVSGPSIRLAEELCNKWGNIMHGHDYIEQTPEYSVVRAYCWDLENNVIAQRTFKVEHRIQTKKGVKVLSDPRDVSEYVNNHASRQKRACMLAVLPRDLIEMAVEQCKTTKLQGIKAEPIVDQVRRMVEAFGKQGVSIDMLEKRLKHKMELTTHEEIDQLRDIHQSMKDGESKREEWFDLGNVDAETSSNSKLNSLAGKDKQP